MEQYIGTKIVEAEPMSLGEFNKRRGWPITGEDLTKEGYLVRYQPDGYESWSPKDVFEKAYRRTDGLNFGLALEAAKLDHREPVRVISDGEVIGMIGSGMNFARAIAAVLRGHKAARLAWGADRLKYITLAEGMAMHHEENSDGSVSHIGKLEERIILSTAALTPYPSYIPSPHDMLANDWAILG